MENCLLRKVGIRRFGGVVFGGSVRNIWFMLGVKKN